MKTVVRIKQKEFEAIAMRMNLTYKKLAERIGISRVYLSQIKNEKYRSYYPSGQLRTKILKLLRCKFDDIFEITQIEDGATSLSNNGVSARSSARARKKNRVH
jgi:DNA-binding XRE family transcriptional regulator